MRIHRFFAAFAAISALALASSANAQAVIKLHWYGDYWDPPAYSIYTGMNIQVINHTFSQATVKFYKMDENGQPSGFLRYQVIAPAQTDINHPGTSPLQLVQNISGSMLIMAYYATSRPDLVAALGCFPYTGHQIAGHLILNDWLGDPTKIATEIVVKQAGTNTVLETHPVTPEADGYYQFLTGLSTNVDLSVKPDRWLSAKLTNVNAGADPQNADFDLINGDTDDSNVVDDADFINLILEFGNFTTTSTADLNGDYYVDDYDLLIVVINFGLAGQ